MVYLNKEAEKMRIAYRYRRLIRSGRFNIGLKEAKSLVGPDTAYHLYGQRNVDAKKKKPPGPDSEKNS